MKTTGYALREAIKLQTLRADEAATNFDSSLKAFPSEGEKEKPQSVVDRYLAAHSAICKLQASQAKYNLLVNVTVGGTTITLSEAIKLIGGLGRAEKMWRSAAAPKKDRYSSSYDDTRDPTREHVVPTITTREAATLASQVAKKASKYRAAISTANTVEVDLEDLDPALFE